MATKKGQPYASVLKTLRRYRRLYGGTKHILLSPYFHVAVIVWLAYFAAGSSFLWWRSAIQLLPTMIGFTLAGYTIMLSFSANESGILLASEGYDESSAYIRASTTFFHFIFVQIVVLLVAFVAEPINTSSAISDLLVGFGLPYEVVAHLSKTCLFTFNKIGELSLFYAVCLALAVLIAVYRLTYVIDLGLTAALQKQLEKQAAEEVEQNNSP